MNREYWNGYYQAKGKGLHRLAEYVERCGHPPQGGKGKGKD